MEDDANRRGWRLGDEHVAPATERVLEHWRGPEVLAEACDSQAFVVTPYTVL